jgi:hypothetical protein
MRALIGRTLTTDAKLNELGLVRASYFSGDVDTVTARPYVVARWLSRLPGVGESRPQGVTFYVHDRPNDYTRINAIIYRMRQVLTGLGPQRTDTGWITQVDWVNDSDDLSDDSVPTILRQTTFTIIASGA